MPELREVAAILDAGKVEASELQAALQALVFHQCLYEDWPHAPSFRLLTRHMVQVQPILAAFGYRVTHHPAERMLVLETGRNPYGVNQMRLKKDETIVLLAARLLYAEGLAQIDDRARVEITTDDIHDRLRACGEDPPSLSRLIEILKAFQRKGLVRVGETDAAEQMAVVTLMPGIAVLVPEAYVEAVRLWLEHRAAGAEAQTDSLLGQVAAYRSTLGSERPPARSHDDEEEADVPA